MEKVQFLRAKMKTKVFESALLRIYITFIKRQLLGIMGNVVISRSRWGLSPSLFSGTLSFLKKKILKDFYC